MSDMTMGNIIDLVSLVYLLWGFGRGLFRGPVREILAVVGFIASLVVAVTMYQSAYAWTGFDFRTGSASLGYLIWFLVLLFGTGILFRLVDLGVRKFTEKTGGLSTAGRLTGGGVGLVKNGFFILFAAFFISGLPIPGLAQFIPQVKEASESKTLRFAAANEWLVHWVSRTNLVGGLRSYLLEGTSRGMTEALVPTEDDLVQDKATGAFQVLLEDPNITERLGESTRARDAGARFEAHPDFAAFLANSEHVRKATEDRSVTLAEIREILTEEREVLEELLKDPDLRAAILAVDIDGIVSDLSAETDE